MNHDFSSCSQVKMNCECSSIINSQGQSDSMPSAWVQNKVKELIILLLPALWVNSTPDRAETLTMAGNGESQMDKNKKTGVHHTRWKRWSLVDFNPQGEMPA